MDVLPIVGSTSVSVHDLVIRAQLCLYCRHQVDKLRSECRIPGVGLNFIEGYERFPFFRQYRAVKVIHDANAKKLLYSSVAAEPDDAVPPQGRNAGDGQDQNSRSGHHPACGVMREKTSSFRAKALSQGNRQFERRLLPRYSAPYKLFHPVPALKNPGAILTGNQVLVYILPGFDRQFMVQIRIKIWPGSFTRPNVKA
jgi:hypothetical protein